MIENWEQMDEFKDFITGFDDSNKGYTKDELVKPFLHITENRQQNHFEQWRDKFYFGIAGDNLPATYLSKWLLGETNIDLDITHSSEKYKATINVRDLVSFLTEGKKREEYHKSAWFLQHKTTIGKISEVKGLRNNKMVR